MTTEPRLYAQLKWIPLDTSREAVTVLVNSVRRRWLRSHGKFAPMINEVCNQRIAIAPVAATSKGE